MARYIERAKFLKKCAEAWGYAGVTIKAIEQIADECTTAEVVPKSEVERLQEALSKAEADVKNYMKVAEYQQNLSVKRYHEIKRLNEDVERLQEEIETFKDTNEHLAVLLEEAKQAYANYEETTGLKQAKQEVAREIFADFKLKAPFFCENQIAYDHFNEELAELKKKYTEEKK